MPWGQHWLGDDPGAGGGQRGSGRGAVADLEGNPDVPGGAVSHLDLVDEGGVWRVG
jgi:hypothetical protein